MDIYIDKAEFSYEIKMLADTFLEAAERKQLCVRSLSELGINADDSFLVITQDRSKANLISGKIYQKGMCRKEISEEIFAFEDLKNAYKRAVYRLLDECYPNKVHSWGILTGIRPVKIVHDLFGQSLDEQEIDHHLKNCYRISEDKAKLAVEIAGLQKKHFNRLDSGIAVYISIPFCPSRCSYCSFFSMDLSRKEAILLSDQYLDALSYEIEQIFLDERLRQVPITSIYVGGGTPSALSVSRIRKLLHRIEQNIPFQAGVEYTFEAGRVDTLDEEKLKAIRSSSVNRISINPQTMNDKTLRKIGRNHSAEDVSLCYEMARKIGFDNINMDIILGLEEEEISDLEHTLRQIEVLSPESLTVHTLSVKRASKLREELDEEKKELSRADVSSFMEKSREYALRMQMSPYYLYRQKNMLFNLENIGYAKKDRESLYNIGMMEERQTIVAFGSGSISKFIYPKENRIERVGNVKDVSLYIQKVAEAVEKKQREIQRWQYATRS